jgi:AraC family transcriptional regulator of adaptative response / DNA-3-methyladenine glycosylase II
MGSGARDHDRMDDFELRYRATSSRDARFDGRFFVGVTSTGIYCRPSCPALTPKRSNVRFYPSAAAAHGAGFRACKRCRPDATPGSPEWDRRADLAGRAMRLIADGIADREGVAGLARRLGYTERHLHRELVASLGAGPQALARARRAETARVLLETTDIAVTDVAFASGFASVRAFNDTVREVYASSPTELRRKAAGAAGPAGAPGSIRLRLPLRQPFDGRALLRFLASRAVPGIEEVDGGWYRRSLALAFGGAIAELAPRATHVDCRLALDDLRDLGSAVHRCRRLLDLDADPLATASALGRDDAIGRLVRRRPGLRVPGHVDGAELAARAVLGQAVTVAAARSLAARLVAHYGKPLTAARGTITHLWPDPDALADGRLSELGMPETRKAAIRNLAAALASGEVELHPGADRDASLARLGELRGVGPWTVGYVAMRALGDPDAWLPSDAGVRRALDLLLLPSDDRGAARVAQAWRPWRAYAIQHLWLLAGDNDTRRVRRAVDRREMQ